MKTTQKIISIKRSINVTDNLKQFIFHNINLRRHIWNKYVEESYNYDSILDFNINKYHKYINDSLIEQVRYNKEMNEDTSLYCSDVALSVYNDVKDAIKAVIRNSKKTHSKHKLRFKSFDRFKGSFKVRTCNEISNISDRPKGKVHFKDENTLEFRASYNYVKNIFNITLKESICDLYDKNTHSFYYYDKDNDIKCYFHHEDIKEVGFVHELGQFYIFIIVNISYIDKINKKYKRNKLAGIDLGIHNPISLYDGNKHINIDMGTKRLNKIRYLERRCKRLQNIMDKKMIINKKRHKDNPNYRIYTKNYIKVQRKFRRTWKRIVDMRMYWRKKLSKIIATMYKNIVVDEFNQPTKEDHIGLPNKVIRRINHYNRNHAMYLFIEALRHACIKYNCVYIEAPDNTTRTCSYCNHKNPKLPLSERVFICEECNTKLDRDMNAAINCYKYFFKRETINE